LYTVSNTKKRTSGFFAVFTSVYFSGDLSMSSTIHPVDEKLPNGQLAALGLQHVLVMYAGAVAVPLIVGRALKLSPQEVAYADFGRSILLWHRHA
jgi:hypothetical protein